MTWRCKTCRWWDRGARWCPLRLRNRTPQDGRGCRLYDPPSGDKVPPAAHLWRWPSSAGDLLEG